MVTNWTQRLYNRWDRAWGITFQQTEWWGSDMKRWSYRKAQRSASGISMGEWVYWGKEIFFHSTYYPAASIAATFVADLSPKVSITLPTVLLHKTLVLHSQSPCLVAGVDKSFLTVLKIGNLTMHWLQSTTTGCVFVLTFEHLLRILHR